MRGPVAGCRRIDQTEAHGRVRLLVIARAERERRDDLRVIRVLGDRERVVRKGAIGLLLRKVPAHWTCDVVASGGEDMCTFAERKTIHDKACLHAVVTTTPP